MGRRTVVITGGSSGIGLAAAVAFARNGDEVVLLGRNPKRLARAVSQVAHVTGRRPPAYRADFAVLDEVRAVGARLAAEYERVDLLANNAGLLAPWTRSTVDGFDVTMQVNHLAGFLLCHLLLPNLRAAAADTGASARIVTTSSLAEAWGWLDVDRPAEPLLRYRSRWLAYGASKRANILFTVEAARRWTPLGVVATCFFPGLVRTGFARSSLLFALTRPVPVLSRSATRAADTLVWLANDDAGLVPGGYYAYRSEFAAMPWSTDPRRAARLWDASLRAVGLA